jgi:transposase
MGMSHGLPLPEKLRVAIVRAFHEQGMSYEEIAELLDVGEATVSRVLRLYRETGGIAPRPRGGGNFSPIADDLADELKKLVAERPDATVPELTEEFTSRTGISTSRSSVLRALHRFGFTRKKSPSSRRSETDRTSGGAVASWPRC